MALVSNNPTPIQEYTIYIDSHNREYKSGVLTGSDSVQNPTNDVTIPIPLPSGRLPAVEFRLGSLELPLSQYTIEPLWQNLYFDEGLDLIVNTQDSQPLLQFGIREATGEIIEANLPPSTNPIVSVSNNGTTTPIFTTFFPHGLELRSAYNWGEDMKIISTPLTNSQFYILSASNPYLTVLSPTTFQLNLTAPVTFTSFGAIFGYVRAPTIPNPFVLAQLINAGLQNRWKLTYDPTTSKFRLCWNGTGCAARDAAPAYLVIPGPNSLPSLMGFGAVNVNIPVPAAEIRSQPITELEIIRRKDYGPSLQETCLTAQNCYQCASFIRVDAGNYDANTLGGNMGLQWNRFFFDQTCANDPFFSESLVVSDSCGTCYTIPIATGRYCPETMASYLQTQLNAIVPGSPNFQVQWDDARGKFTFSADVDFGLEFDGSNMDLAQRLGFLAICYRNQNRYESTQPIHVPRKGCCQTNLPARCASYIYTPILLGTERKYRIERCKPRGLRAGGGAANPYAPPFSPATTGFNDNGNGTGTIVFANAHGFNVNDVVCVTFPGAPSPPGEGPHYFQVVQVVNFQTVVVDTGSLDTSGLPADAAVCAVLEGKIVGNLYFGVSCFNARYQSILPRILGYMEEDVILDPSTPETVWNSPSCFSLDWPGYLLMVVTDPIGSTKNEHLWERDSKAHVFGKIILYPQYRLERIFPIRMQLHDMKTINRMHIQILNPDHTLYQLHGKDWSATIVFNILEEQGNLLAI